MTNYQHLGPAEEGEEAVSQYFLQVARISLEICATLSTTLNAGYFRLPAIDLNCYCSATKYSSDILIRFCGTISVILILSSEHSLISGVWGALNNSSSASAAEALTLENVVAVPKKPTTVTIDVSEEIPRGFGRGRGFGGRNAGPGKIICETVFM